LPPVGRVHLRDTVTSPVLGTPATIIGSELVVQLGYDPSLCPTLIPQGVSYVQFGVVYVRNIIPIEI
jgi:hypothetical protein